MRNDGNDAQRNENQKGDAIPEILFFLLINGGH
jgi:hypothetical protein